MVNFCAKYIDLTSITDITNKNKCNDKKVNIVHLSPYNQDDVLSLHHVAMHWHDKDKYAKYIANDAFEAQYDAFQHRDKEFFAITLQDNDFEQLQPNRVLALVELRIRLNQLVEILLLQVNPNFNSQAIASPYKNIGSAFLNFIKQRFYYCNILVDPDTAAIGFYKKNGFKIMDFSSKMIFKRKIKF